MRSKDGAFDRTLLPPASAFYRREFSNLSRPSRDAWAKCNCPWHNSKSKLSLCVNLSHGGFYCHGCGKKGGDIVAFLMERDRLSFRAACESLGAWVGGAEADQARIAQERKARERKRQAEIDAKEAARQEAARQELIRARDWLHTLEEIYRIAAAELEASPEQEKLWASMAMLHEEIREQERIYRELAGIEAV